MTDCLFCRIVEGSIPSRRVYEDDTVLAFADIAPRAPVHFLVIPKTHIRSVAEVDGSNSSVVAHCFEVIAQLAAEQGLGDGFRVISNVGDNGCQSVPHLHFHVLGGAKLPE